MSEWQSLPKLREIQTKIAPIGTSVKNTRPIILQVLLPPFKSCPLIGFLTLEWAARARKR